MPKVNPNQSQQRSGATPDELKYMQHLYQNQYVLITQELNSRIQALGEITNSQATLERIDMVKKKKALVPIGAETYLDGTISDSEAVVVGVGAGYLVEKDVAGAKAHIAKAIEKETQYINKLMKSKKELEAALMEVSYKLEELAHKV